MLIVTAPEVPPPLKLVPAVTAVISPELLVNPESLLKADKGISEISFLLSAPLSSKINSSCELLIAAVISVSSDKSKLNANVPVPVIVPPPSKPAAVVTSTLVTPELVT